MEKLFQDYDNQTGIFKNFTTEKFYEWKNKMI